MNPTRNFIVYKIQGFIQIHFRCRAYLAEWNFRLKLEKLQLEDITNTLFDGGLFDDSDTICWDKDWPDFPNKDRLDARCSNSSLGDSKNHRLINELKNFSAAIFMTCYNALFFQNRIFYNNNRVVVGLIPKINTSVWVLFNRMVIFQIFWEYLIEFWVQETIFRLCIFGTLKNIECEPIYKL